MNRKVLLIEPNYKNKYPPMGLMKIATYYRMKGDDVRFYKGDLQNFVVELLAEDLIIELENNFPEVFWKESFLIFKNFIKKGIYNDDINKIVSYKAGINEILNRYRKKFKDKDFPKFDKVGITTLFTFYWKKTIETINFAKKLCKSEKDVMIGGIMSTLLADEVFEETGIKPFVGLLDKPGIIDKDDQLIIDELPLDYSILDEIDYVYPANHAYFAYMTRGCVNKCKFCAVPKLEPHYCNYIGIKDKLIATKNRFGEQQDLLLLDNNILASTNYEQIIDEIKSCGFGVGSKYISSNEYDITIKNLQDSYNDRAYIRKAVNIYNEILSKLKNEQEIDNLRNMIEKYHCLNYYTATKESIFSLDQYVKPIYNSIYKPKKKKRIVDFNQGIDARLVNENNMAKLAEINIYPLRIAFDHWNLRNIYENAIRIAVKFGIKHLSNYLLYNFEDKPEELYYRLRLNVELCEELGASIYSFPMKYHPIQDKDFFKNRNYIGKYWNRKFIRAVQAVLNSTKGKIGKGITFFEVAFGSNVDEFMKILWMPESFIINRRRYDANLREKLSDKYINLSVDDCDLTNEWWNKFSNLSIDKSKLAKQIIGLNHFKQGDYICNDPEIEEVLKYYRISK